MARTKISTEFEFNKHNNRAYFELKLGKKLRLSQWQSIEKFAMLRGLMSDKGIIRQEDLDLMVKIKQAAGKFHTNTDIFNAFFDWYKTSESMYGKDKAQIPGFSVRNDLIAKCKKHNGYEPKNQTINSWFFRSGLSYGSAKLYSLNDLVSVYIKCIFSRSPQKKLDSQDS